MFYNFVLGYPLYSLQSKTGRNFSKKNFQKIENAYINLLTFSRRNIELFVSCVKGEDEKLFVYICIWLWERTIEPTVKNFHIMLGSSDFGYSIFS